MYRTLAILSLLKVIFAVTASTAYGFDECVNNGVVPAEGCKVESSKYVYDSAYNGRDTDGSDIATTAEANSLIVPAGYYENKSLTWTSENLNPANLAEGISAFGVTGILNASSLAACTANQSTANATPCNAAPGTYSYARDAGGRGLDCTVTNGNQVTGACYLTSSGTSIRTEPTPSACFASGIVNKTCLVTSGSYWYTSAFNGRSATCVNGTNTVKCWLPVESASASVANTCKENADTAGYNASACKTAATNRYVYSSNKGGRATDCSDNDTGYCWISTATKAATASSLTASNIRATKVVFGITGNYTGTPFEWGSGAHRTKSGSASLTRMSYSTESGLAVATNITSVAASPGYHPVPKVASSTDGYNQASVVTPVNRTSWATTQCGLTGTIGTRAADCTTTFTPNALWVGEKNGNAGQASWQLITRRWNSTKNRAFEVWQDQATGLLWSSQTGAGINWCHASGNSNSTKVRAELQEVDPFNLCSNTLYQGNNTNNAISACYEGTGFSATDLPEGKAGLNMTNSVAAGKVAWRLPTIYDYMLANHHGVRFVLPDIWINGEEWTATTYARDRSKAWTFDGFTGSRQPKDRVYSLTARCVGR